MHFLHAPAALNKFRGEPIEKFRMRGLRTGEAEVVWGGDQAASEMILPDAIHENAGGEWVFRTRYPLGECDPPPAGRKLPITIAATVHAATNVRINVWALVAVIFSTRSSCMLPYSSEVGEGFVSGTIITIWSSSESSSFIFPEPNLY